MDTSTTFVDTTSGCVPAVVTPAPCPHCGYCPTCGKARTAPYNPWYPQVYPWSQIYPWVTYCQGNTSTDTTAMTSGVTHVTC